MNGSNFAVDTNILLYILSGHQSIEKIINYNLFISEITEIELLGYKNISDTQLKNRHNLLTNCTLVNLSEPIKQITIALRQNYNIKIPDAIIAATAIYLNLPLITADKGFKKIEELNLLFTEFN